MAVEDVKFSSHSIPLGTSFLLGHQRWILLHRNRDELSYMTFGNDNKNPVSKLPDRVMSPLEVEHLYKVGVPFTWPDPTRPLIEPYLVMPAKAAPTVPVTVASTTFK